MSKPTDNDVRHLTNFNAKVRSLTKVQVLVLKMTRHSQSVYWLFQDCKGSSPSRRGCAKLTTLCGYEPHWIGAVQWESPNGRPSYHIISINFPPDQKIMSDQKQHKIIAQGGQFRFLHASVATTIRQKTAIAHKLNWPELGVTAAAAAAADLRLAINSVTGVCVCSSVESDAPRGNPVSN